MYDVNFKHNNKYMPPHIRIPPRLFWLLQSTCVSYKTRLKYLSKYSSNLTDAQSAVISCEACQYPGDNSSRHMCSMIWIPPCGCFDKCVHLASSSWQCQCEKLLLQILSTVKDKIRDNWSVVQHHKESLIGRIRHRYASKILDKLGENRIKSLSG